MADAPLMPVEPPAIPHGPGTETATREQPVEEMTAPKWLMEIERAEKESDRYSRRARKIVKIYTEQVRDESRTDRQFAMLWANTETLKPAVYSRGPKPVVSRRFNDQDRIGKAVAEVLERALISSFERQGVHETMLAVRDDFILVARGTAWVRYEPKFSTEVYGEGQEPVEALIDETLQFDFVSWADIIYPKARRWNELPWVGRRVYLDKQAFIGRFGEELYKECATKEGNGIIPRAETKPGVPRDKTAVYEIWSKRDNCVVWVTKTCQRFLDKQPPLYTLQNFFPCPEPAFGSKATDSLTPIPDYTYYQDQAEEVNDLTAKIGALNDALKLVGFYPAGAEGGISTAIETAASPSTRFTQMVPVPGWAAFQQGGGSRDMIQWWPIEVVTAALKAAIELRRQMIEDIYQITGISDILRGSTQASETATAQQIKAQWGGIRIRDKQQELARFARDLARIGAEIMAEKFQPETLWKMTGLRFPTQAEKEGIRARLQAYMQQMQGGPQVPAQIPPGTPPQQSAQPAPDIPDEIQEILDSPTQEEVVQLLRDDQSRSYRVEIETDSTIAPDEQAQQESVNQFITAVGGFMQQAMPIGATVPEFVPVMGEMLTLVARSYRAGRQLEDSIDEAVDKLSAKAVKATKAPPKPDPEMVKAELAAKTSDQEMALKQRELDARIANDRDRLAIDREDKQNQHLIRVAGHNKQMIGEAQQLADQRQADELREPTMIEQVAEAIRQVAGLILQGQQAIIQNQSQQAIQFEATLQAALATLGQRNDAQMGAIMEGQQRIADGQEAILAALTAPKKIIRDPTTGRATGVEMARTLN